MSTTDDTNAARRGSGSNDLLGLASGARWYCVSREGVATLCLDEEDARWNVAHCDMDWRAGSPHRAVRLVDMQHPLTRQQIDAVMTEHYPLDSLLRENVDAFEACVRDIERLHGIVA